MTGYAGRIGTALGLALFLAGCDGGGGDTSGNGAGGAAANPGGTAVASSGAAPAAGERSRAADNPAGWPPIEFEPGRLHFGVISPGQTVSGVTRIWNVGSQPLRILGSGTSCGCTTVDDLGGRVIEPGGFTAFTTTLTPKSGLGEKQEGIRFQFAGYGQIVEYRFGAEVSLPVRAVPPHITALDTLRGVVELNARDGRPFRVLGAGGAPPVYESGRTPPGPVPGHRLVWDITEADARGAVPWFWVIETDHPEAPVIDVRIRHDSTRPVRVPGRPWVPKDQRVLVGLVRPGEPIALSTKLEYVRNRAPQAAGASVVARSAGVSVGNVQAVPDGQYLVLNVLLEPRADLPSGLVYESIELQASGFSAPLLVIGRVP